MLLFHSFTFSAGFPILSIIMSIFSFMSFSSVQLLSHVRLCDPMNRSTLGLAVHHQLPEFTQTHVHWVGDAIQPSHPLSSPSPPALNLSQHQGLFQMSQLRIRWPKYWSLNFSISASKEYSGLISFKMDWLDLFPGQGTLKSLLQHHSSKTPILWCSAFFIVQLSHPYMTTGKTINMIITSILKFQSANSFFLFVCFLFYFIFFIYFY